MTSPTISYTPDDDSIAPCAIIGGGVAGHATAVWLDAYGVPFRWIASTGEVGGILHRVFNTLVNVPGHRFDHGRDLSDGIARQVERASFDPPEAQHIERIHATPEYFELYPADAPMWKARVVVVATGTQYTRLEVPGGEDSAHVTHEDSAFISYSASQDGARFAGQRVGVVGGGDAAFENALILAGHSCEVHLFLRSRPKARRAFVNKVHAHEAITIWPIPTTVQRVLDERADGVTLALDVDGVPQTLEVSGLFIRIGVTPVAPEIDPAPDHQANGAIDVDLTGKTSVPRLYALGDVTSRDLRAIVCAAADGARCALDIAHELGAYGVEADEVG